eukprot:365166-Chlamydomonas_euryale.AAC.13
MEASYRRHGLPPEPLHIRTGNPPHTCTSWPAKRRVSVIWILRAAAIEMPSLAAAIAAAAIARASAGTSLPRGGGSWGAGALLAGAADVPAPDDATSFPLPPPLPPTLVLLAGAATSDLGFWFCGAISRSC